MTPRTTARSAAILAAAAATLAGCAGTRTVAFEVLSKDGSPVRGAHLMAVRLDTGSTPLPINDATINEMLLKDKTSEQAWTDAHGVARLTIAAGRPHLVQAHPPMFSPDADRGAPPARFRLSEHADTLTPVEAGPSWAGEVRVLR